ncbi:Hsp70 family protein [Nocardia otitidiscaviarum]|uniref:Hsp70 family protein n=1 Tax=Nocardia otitidiscaviarum TaxID=1823 RepID=UPI0018952C5C|nr:Hsp70 family protein [Nocardia otitidiscaviarum]MBF6179710.1 Hsp70 family protein [Nocardia otitidiscaviarum]
MRTSLGISAGSEVVCSATVATAPNGVLHFDYRVVTADTAHSDLGDLVASSIELMTTHQLSRDIVHPVGTHSSALSATRHGDHTPPGDIAVAYRDREQAQTIRSAIGRQRRDVRLIPESGAALAYLRHTGMLERYETIAIIDLGASGATVTVADQADDTVLRSERTTAISGNAIDELILQHLLDCHLARRGTRPNRGMLLNRSRAAKEHLAIAQAVTIDHVAGQPLKLTRKDFDELIADLLRELAVFARGVFARAPKFPQCVAVIGGGANVPAVVRELEEQLDVPVCTVPEPEAAIAKGAALVADSAQPTALTVIGRGTDAPVGTFTKLVGTLAGAIVVVGLVIGYGVKELVPEDRDYSPVGTTSGEQLDTTTPTTTAPGTAPMTQNRDSTGPAPATPTTAPDTDDPTTSTGPRPTPTTPAQSPPPLRPDPGLPQIPFPAELPRILGPFLGTPVSPTEEPDPSETSPNPTGPSTNNPSTTAPTTPAAPRIPRSNSGSAGGGSVTAPLESSPERAESNPQRAESSH